MWIRNRIRVQLFTLMRIRCQLFTSKADADPDPYHGAGNLRPMVQLFEPLGLYCESLKILNFYFHAYPAPAFHSNSNPDPPSKNNADPCGSKSATLVTKILTPENVLQIPPFIAAITTNCRTNDGIKRTEPTLRRTLA
jgi:hypothetical protein